MKGIFLFLALTASLLFSSGALAAWYAEASSNSAWGWGKAATRWQAEQIAMNNCRARTPTWDVCWIVVSQPAW